MISKKRIRLIRSLETKKFRRLEGMFVAEGPKLVGEILPHMRLRYIAATSSWYMQNKNIAIEEVEHDIIDERELKQISFLQHPQQVIALFAVPEYYETIAEVAKDELAIALDGIQDPGNLGTIVRLADWFGIKHIFCSLDTVDIYNPKSVQATMGAIGRVKVHYVDLPKEISEFNGKIYGTLLDGDNIYESQLSSNGVIVMGNEGKGISSGVNQLVNSRLYIPSYPNNKDTVESLNVAVATAIVCAEFRRRMSC